MWEYPGCQVTPKRGDLTVTLCPQVSVAGSPLSGDCTKWPYLGLPDIRLHDSITLGSQAFLCHDGAAGGETISMLKIHARKPSQSGRSEPTAELAQPALSSRRAYIPAAVTPDRPSTHLVTQNLSIQDMRLCSEGLFIPHRGDALWMRIS